ncbi:MAG: M3 family metallopeptidase, partial [Opitutales bacterium]|nr:M3 family metallopeptidase [Opitutales bacterium]
MEHPFLDPEFEICWSQLKPEYIEPDMTLALEEAQGRVDELAGSGLDGRTFDNTLLALESATDTLDWAWGLVGHLDSVCNSDALRVAYNAMLPKVTEFYARVPLNDKLWKVIKAYAETDDAADLTGPRKRFLDETLADFRDQGADLPPEPKKRLEALEAELAQITQKFGENVLDATNAWELYVDDESKLAGLPETARATALADAKSKGKGTDDAPVWRFTLHYPSMAPVLQHLDDEEIRRKVWKASSLVGHKDSHDNTDLIWKILKLRQEKAEILGKDDFADMVLERRMAKDGLTADSFVTDLHDRIIEAFETDGQTLREYKASRNGGDPSMLKPWEVGYWAEKQRKELYDFDEEELRPYFPVGRVIDGLYDLA